MPTEFIAVLLAAGVGRRLGDNNDKPKALLDFAGISLLERSMKALHYSGVRQLFVTVGHQAELIRHATTQTAIVASGEMEVRFIDNPLYREGSLVSLHAQQEVLKSGRDILLLDGDVLYDPRMIERLLKGRTEGVLLVDREIEPGDEPVKICFDEAGQIVDFRKVPTKPHVWFGEFVGFFRFSAALASELSDRCAWYMDQGLVKTEYEEAIRDLILASPHRFSAEDVSDLAWTEIDFPEDVVRARDVILPQLRV